MPDYSLDGLHRKGYLGSSTGRARHSGELLGQLFRTGHHRLIWRPAILPTAPMYILFYVSPDTNPIIRFPLLLSLRIFIQFCSYLSGNVQYRREIRCTIRIENQIVTAFCDYIGNSLSKIGLHAFEELLILRL